MLEALIDFLRTLTTPERLIKLLTTVFTGWLGYALLFGVVFAETGLLTGFFLPGDSFLFTVGVVAGAGQLRLEWWGRIDDSGPSWVIPPVTGWGGARVR
jgi:membrane protein DedA with SNARE-associated domain